MHEFGIARKLLSAVLEESEKAGEIKEVWIALGELADVTEQELRMALGEVSKGTRAEKAEIHIEMKQPKITCRNGHETALGKETACGGSLFIKCPECGATATVTGGRECEVVKARAE